MVKAPAKAKRTTVVAARKRKRKPVAKAPVNAAAPDTPVATALLSRRLYTINDVTMMVSKFGDEIQIPLPNYRVITKVMISIHPRNVKTIKVTTSENFQTVYINGESLRNVGEYPDGRPWIDVPLPDWEGLDNRVTMGNGFISLIPKDDYPVYVTVRMHMWCNVEPVS